MLKEVLKKISPSFLINWYHFLLALFGAVFYQFPSRKMVVIGITGTNGKSTVVELISKILQDTGSKVASISSIKFKIKDKEWENTLKQTMPGRFQLQKFLREALNAGCQYAILEVTSEGILQYRHKFIDFDVAVFANLTPEHIEAHSSFEKYREAKGKFFQATKGIHIVNLDDENAEYFSQFPAKEKWGYGINWKLRIGNWKLIKATDITTSFDGIHFKVENTIFHLNLLGSFNVSNALAAICVGLSQGVNLETCKSALERVEGIPGRMEVVINEPFTVIVDYAHTPDSLEKVYRTISDFRLQTSEFRMICVLGACGGGRDKWKRPVLGKLASQYCDRIFITNEDPYGENPMRIIEEVAKGTEDATIDKDKFASIYRILDRREAIRVALKLAKPGDSLIITGKGCEPWICVVHGKKIPWDDREVVKEEFAKIKKQK